MTEQTDSLAQYFKSMHDVTASVSRKEMFELWKRASRGDRRAKKRIMELNMRLVIPTAKKYHRPGTELMDLIEEGNLGLLHAIDKFEPKKGYRFSTYATYWIEQYIRRAVEEQSGSIRIPPHARDALRQWLRKWNELHAEMGREPTLAEMADRLNWTPRQVKAVLDALEAAQGVGSLASTVDGSEDGLTLEETIVDHSDNSPDHMLSNLRLHDDFDKALEKIGDREKKILQYRYGLSGKSPMTLEEIGKKLGLSRERVRQIEEHAVLRLRRVTHTMGLIDASETMASTPNLHPGTIVAKGPTNILGQPVGNHPLKLIQQISFKNKKSGK